MDVAEFADGKEHDAWLKLEKEPPKKSKEEGEIHVKIKFTGKPKKVKEEKEEKEEKEKKEEKETNKGKDEKKEKKSKGPANIEDKYNVGKIIGRYKLHPFVSDHKGVLSLLSRREPERLTERDMQSNVSQRNSSTKRNWSF